MYASAERPTFSNSTESSAHPRHRGELVRWLCFAFLTAVFFLMAHDFGHASRAMDNYNLTKDELAARSAEGPPGRRIALGVLGLAAIISLIYSRENRRLYVQGIPGWSLFLFVGWACLSPIWASDPMLTLKRLVPFVIFSIAALAVARRFSLRDIVQWTFVSTLLFSLTGVLATLVYGTFHPLTPGYRFGGTLDPNSQGVNCALLLLSAAVSADLKKRWRVPAVIGGTLGFILLILTGSRTGFAAAIVALLVYFVSVRSRKAIVAGGAIVSIVCCSLLLFMGSDLAQSLSATVLMGRDDAGSVDSFNGRSLIWQDLSGYINQRPILGIGYGDFWTPARILQISDEEKVGGISSSHSAYIEYLLGLGTVGLIGYAVLLVCGTWRAFRNFQEYRNVAYAFFGAFLIFCIVDGMLDSDITVAGTPLMFLWMVVSVRLSAIESGAFAKP